MQMLSPYTSKLPSMFSFIKSSLPLVMLALSIFILTFFNMYFIVDYKNDALVAGYGIANTIWSCTILCPNISLG
jgi:hypothetical protein